MEQKGGWRDTVTGDLEAYLSERNCFYLGTASADGQPYIQHRGRIKIWGELEVVEGDEPLSRKFGMKIIKALLNGS
jgi:hypothetical protein